MNKTHIEINIGSNRIIKEINPLDQWNHIVLTYDGLNIILYLNGVEIISERDDSGVPRNINDIFIGNLFYGSIDEVAIYDRILTTNEVQNHFNYPGFTG
jgi:hypothetical protein